MEDHRTPLVKFLQHAAYGPLGDCLIVVPRRIAGDIQVVDQIIRLLKPECVTYVRGQSLKLFGRRAYLVGANEYERLRGLRVSAVLMADDSLSRADFLDALEWCKSPGAPTFRT